MQIVEIDTIPEAHDVSIDNPMAVLRICQEMEEFCEQQEGIGLSAVQVGIPQKLFVMKSGGCCPDLYGDNTYTYFVNCDYEATDENCIVTLEGCLSVRSKDGQLRVFQVKRHKNIRLFGYRLDINKNVCFTPVDLMVDFEKQCVVLQHEIDHQKCKLISDHGKEIFIW